MFILCLSEFGILIFIQNLLSDLMLKTFSFFYYKLSSWLSYMHKKVIVPMRRSHKNPTYLVRSNAIGMGLAFAPFPGQVPVVLALWILLRRSKYRFSLAISVAWTFISNVFTNLPLFYLYYLTGAFFRQDNVAFSYAELKELFANGIFQAAGQMGMNILYGSLFYMLIFGALGYYLGMRKQKKT